MQRDAWLINFQVYEEAKRPIVKGATAQRYKVGLYGHESVRPGYDAAGETFRVQLDGYDLGDLLMRCPDPRREFFPKPSPANCCARTRCSQMSEWR